MNYDDVRKAIKLLSEIPRYDGYDEWPKTKDGRPKLLAYDLEADRLITSGEYTEDDLIRIKPIPTTTD